MSLVELLGSIVENVIKVRQIPRNVGIDVMQSTQQACDKFFGILPSVMSSRKVGMKECQHTRFIIFHI